MGVSLHFINEGNRIVLHGNAAFTLVIDDEIVLAQAEDTRALARFKKTGWSQAGPVQIRGL